MKNNFEPNHKNMKTNDTEDIIKLILRDHVPLKKLIETLKDGEIERSEKEGAFEQFVPLLVAHAKAEEKSLYVQMKKVKDLRVESFEGDTEHAIAENLIHEINATADDDKWNAKVKVLAELVEQHIEEEEEEMLEDVKKQMDLSMRKAVGDLYTELKTEFDLLYHARYTSARFTSGRKNIELFN